MKKDDKPKQVKDSTNRPKPLVPKTALKKGVQYGKGGKLRK